MLADCYHCSPHGLWSANRGCALCLAYGDGRGRLLDVFADRAVVVDGKTYCAACKSTGCATWGFINQQSKSLVHSLPCAVCRSQESKDAYKQVSLLLAAKPPGVYIFDKGNLY